MPFKIHNTALDLEEGPFPLSNWNPPSHGAIYGILMKRENGEYRLIYIGQSENLSELVFKKLRAYPCLLREAGESFESIPSLPLHAICITGTENPDNARSHQIGKSNMQSLAGAILLI